MFRLPLLLCTFALGAVVAGSEDAGPDTNNIDEMDDIDVQLTHYETLLHEHGARKDVRVLDSSIHVRVLTEGRADGATPGEYNECQINFKAFVIGNDTAFASMDADKTVMKRPTDMSLKGLQEAILQMKEGDEWEVVIPSEKAYGKKGMRDVPGGAAVVVHLRLDEVGPETSWFSATLKMYQNNPVMVLIALMILKRLGDWYFGVSITAGRSGTHLPLKMVSNDLTPRVYFDVSVEGGKKQGRIEIELFDKSFPYQTEVFQQVCSRASQLRSSVIKSVKKDAMFQIGELARKVEGLKILAEQGKCYVSHGDAPFLVTSKFIDDHNERVVYFITTSASADLDKDHNVIGHVTAGEDLVKAINECGSDDGTISKKIKITDCGAGKTKAT
jgi:cyclophilin family peptidyl-prolyl cis-trans isomerase